MPILDMPVKALYEYRGVTPCPTDIDEFWNESLRRLAQVDPEAVFERAAFQAPGAQCFDLWFTGMKNARVHAKYLRPEKLNAPAPAVLVFHGYSGAAPAFTELMNYVCAGFVVAALDCRGQGGQSEDVGGVRGGTLHGHIMRGMDEDDARGLLFHDIFLDCARMADIVMRRPEVDAARVGATGSSQGGGLTLACAALEPRVRRAAPCVPFLCDYRRVWDMDLDVSAYADLRDYFRRFDPLHEREADIFYRLGYIDVKNLTHRVKADVMMFTGLLDNICPPSTQFAAFNALTTPKQVALYPDFGHEGLPGSGDRIMTFMLGM